VIREEFRKLLDKISDRVTLAENRLDGLEAHVNGVLVNNSNADTMRQSKRKPESAEYPLMTKSSFLDDAMCVYED